MVLEVGDIIRVNKKGPPKYYMIEKICQTLYLVKKCKAMLVDQFPIKNQWMAHVMWIDWDQNCNYPYMQHWIKGAEKKYIPIGDYPMYNGSTYVLYEKLFF